MILREWTTHYNRRITEILDEIHQSQQARGKHFNPSRRLLMA
jgi:hypothetical protein